MSAINFKLRWQSNVGWHREIVGLKSLKLNLFEIAVIFAGDRLWGYATQRRLLTLGTGANKQACLTNDVFNAHERLLVN